MAPFSRGEKKQFHAHLPAASPFRHPFPSPCPARELPASTVPPAPSSGRQLPRRPPLHQSPTSVPGRGHARLPPEPARPLPGARRQAREAPAGKGVRRRVGTRTHQCVLEVMYTRAGSQTALGSFPSPHGNHGQASS